jgi:hypothetical protein
MNTLIEKLLAAKTRLDDVISLLEHEPELGAISDLIEACEDIDYYYKHHVCKERDDGDGLVDGTTYKNGMNVEFYIEAEDWHRVSLALRKLRKKEIL